ncbi:MAG: hypothetical protein AB8F78_12350 [Saprospiraceae bacterium]
MKNLLLAFGLMSLTIACGTNSEEAAEVSAEYIQEIEQTEAAVIALDSINSEIQASSDQLDALLQELD